MDDRKLKKLIDNVKDGRLSRRAFIRRMAAVGLTAPMASQLLAFGGVAMASTPKFEYAPTKRGGGGALKVLFWQAPTLLNPHFGVGTKDQNAARIFYEPLASWDPDGNLIANLAAEIPSRENGGIAADGLSVTWKLKKDVIWHDGKPFTADDCVFNWEFARNPGTAATTSGSYKDIKVEKVDTHTIKVIFAKPTPFWADAFVGSRGMIIPKHLYEAYMGDKSRDAPANLKPVGTGPYTFVDFKPGDTVRGALFDKYHKPNRPYFDTIEMKGGGDAVSAARAVLQAGEFDYAWNMQVEDAVLKNLETGGKGTVHITEGGNVEMILLNNTDPWTEVDGERSSLKTKHPFLTEPAVRQAMALLVDRISVEKHIYGRTGVASSNFVNSPPKYRSPNTSFEFNVDKAAKLLEDAGWKKGADGIREKGGKKLKLVYQTSINAPRQKTQAIVKQACQKAGIDVELKSITASVFFSSDVANPDTFTKFYTDIEMYTTTMPQPDPEVFLNQFTSWEIATKENKWQGRNITRWQSKEYDDTYKAAQNELDPIKRAAMMIKLNDLIINNQAIIPVVARPSVAARAGNLAAYISGWDLDLFAISDWHRKA